MDLSFPTLIKGNNINAKVIAMSNYSLNTTFIFHYTKL